MQKIWFRNKTYGWGWYPSAWQGWAVLGLFIVLLAWNIRTLPISEEPPTSALVYFFVKVAVLVLALLAVCYKTGEKPAWQWGKEKNQPKQ